MAILKMNNPPANLPPLVFGDCNALLAGEPAIVIGNALGIGISYTAGIISRTVDTINGREAIQTDAAVNPGNSGGALLNSQGKLIGMITFKLYSDAEKEILAEGMGFALTSNSIIEYIDAADNERTDIIINYVN